MPPLAQGTAMTSFPLTGWVALLKVTSLCCRAKGWGGLVGFLGGVATLAGIPGRSLH